MHIIPTEGMAVHAGGFLYQTVRKICQGYLSYVQYEWSYEQQGVMWLTVAAHLSVQYLYSNSTKHTTNTL